MPPPTPPTNSHYSLMAEAAKRGSLSIFYGAGANFAQCRPPRNYSDKAPFLPTGSELALYLAEKYNFPDYSPIRLFDQKINQAGQDPCRGCELITEATTLIDRFRAPDLA